jgi:hypothetical protein
MLESIMITFPAKGLVSLVVSKDLTSFIFAHPLISSCRKKKCMQPLHVNVGHSHGHVIATTMGHGEVGYALYFIGEVHWLHTVQFWGT